MMFTYVSRSFLSFVFVVTLVALQVNTLQAETLKTVEANGITFSYIEEGTGPLILLVHGYPESARSWHIVQNRLAAAGYRVVAPFTRGYAPTGASETGDYSVKALGADVIALIEALGETEAVLVGHDWGASTVYEAATLAPERVVKLVALSVPHPLAVSGDPAILLEAPHFLYYQLPFIRQWVARNNFQHIDAIYEEWSPTYDVPESVLADIKSTFAEPGGLDGALGYYWSLFDDELNAGRASSAETVITMPTLVITGTADGAVSVERFPAAEPAFVGGYKLVTLENIGHFPQLEAPEEVANLILEFLKD